jgi:hypothetical protein
VQNTRRTTKDSLKATASLVLSFTKARNEPKNAKPSNKFLGWPSFLEYLKRGGGALRVSLGEAATFTECRGADLIALGRGVDRAR